jgi:hypothetical protein
VIRWEGDKKSGHVGGASPVMVRAFLVYGSHHCVPLLLHCYVNPDHAKFTPIQVHAYRTIFGYG